VRLEVRKHRVRVGRDALVEAQRALHKVGGQPTRDAR
jgi:hypothetical protein